MIRQSFAWWAFHRHGNDPTVLLSGAKEAGYAAVELITQELWDTARAAGLVISSASAHDGIGRGFNDRSNHVVAIEQVRHAIESAQSCDIPNLIVFSGSRFDGISDDEGAEAVAEGLAQLAPEAEAAGVKLVLELLNSKIDHPCYQADHTAFALKVCDAVNSPAVKILYDIYHMQIMEGDLIRTLREAMPRIGHIHTAGNPGRIQIDGRQEIHYPAVFRAIAETGYDGYICHEFVPRGDAVDELRVAYEITAAAFQSV